jgi:murein DD-endopeptidase MepM/ murein hydrolase activator NlpD
MTTLKHSVGNGGMNLSLDARYVQRLLNIKLAKINKKIKEDGNCGKKTNDAIREFQQKILKLAHPDGLIEPGKITFKGLVAGITSAELVHHWNAAVVAENTGLITTAGRIAAANTKHIPLPSRLTQTVPAITSAEVGEYCFPLDFVPTPGYQKGEGARYFGANRDKGARLHAGCDLIAKPGTPVYAIADGRVEQNSYYFYKGTYALEIYHAKVLVRYGELIPSGAATGFDNILAHITMDATVRKGQIIGYVGKLISGSSMLHFETYSGTATGGLTVKGKESGKYKRRSDLLDPTNLLNASRSSLPTKGDSLDNKLLEGAIKYGHSQSKVKGY